MSAGRTWWSSQWLTAVEQRAQLDPNRLPRARRYARGGTVRDLHLEPGEVRATVAGRDDQPYSVRVRVRTFTDGEWRQVIEAIAAHATYAAALHGADLPPDVAATVRETGLDLVPGPAEIGPRCTCPDDADPCKHSAAVCYLIADALDADPFVILQLRGRTREEVLAGLRSLRQQQPQAQPGPLAVPGRPSSPEGTSPAAENGSDHPAGRAATEDPGIDAREVLARTAWDPVPDPPAPPRRAGQPVSWPIDPPPGLSGLRTDLLALAADAARRAWELAVGTATPDTLVGLDDDSDLARRADRALGTSAFTALAARAGIAERELARWGLAWRHSGALGFETLRHRWDPNPEGDAGIAHLLIAARTALGGAGSAARIRGDRVTAAGRQLRLGRDYRWYPYQRIHNTWEPAGPPASDPAVAIARTWPPNLAEPSSGDVQLPPSLR